MDGDITAERTYEAWVLRGDGPALLTTGASAGECDRALRTHDGACAVAKAGRLLRHRGAEAAVTRLRRSIEAHHRERGMPPPAPLPPPLPPPIHAHRAALSCEECGEPTPDHAVDCRAVETPEETMRQGDTSERAHETRPCCAVQGCTTASAGMRPGTPEALAVLCQRHRLAASQRSARGTPLAEAVAGVIAGDKGRQSGSKRAPAAALRKAARKTPKAARKTPKAAPAQPDALARVVALVRRVGGLAALETLVSAWETLREEVLP